MQRLLQSDPAEAYFCGDDVVSIGAMAALQEAGLSVPDDVGIIGFNDMEMARWRNIDLTTIRQPVDAVVAHSIECVAQMLATPDVTPEPILLSCDLVDRGTLRAPTA